MILKHAIKQFELSRPFGSKEAWLLFRLAAFAEAGGWTLLLTGIALKHFAFHGNDTPVQIAGQLHGMLFLFYIVACVVLYPSLRWKRWKAILAGLCSIPPYGSLLFEQWVVHYDRHQTRRRQLSLQQFKYLEQSGFSDRY